MPPAQEPRAAPKTKFASLLPLVLLVLAILLFALGPAVLKLLTMSGGKLGITAPGSISFCSVLFIGNLCAGLVTLVFAGPRRILRELVSVPRATKVYLVLGAVVFTIHPALLYSALEETTLLNVVLLSRFHGIAYVVVGYLFLRAVVSRLEVLGYAIIAVGVLVPRLR